MEIPECAAGSKDESIAALNIVSVESRVTITGYTILTLSRQKWRRRGAAYFGADEHRQPAAKGKQQEALMEE